jgi:hypothetical protein
MHILGYDAVYSDKCSSSVSEGYGASLFRYWSEILWGNKIISVYVTFFCQYFVL